VEDRILEIATEAEKVSPDVYLNGLQSGQLWGGVNEMIIICRVYKVNLRVITIGNPTRADIDSDEMLIQYDWHEAPEDRSHVIIAWRNKNHYYDPVLKVGTIQGCITLPSSII